MGRQLNGRGIDVPAQAGNFRTVVGVVVVDAQVILPPMRRRGYHPNVACVHQV